MTFGIPFQRVYDVKTLGFHQLFDRFKRPFFYEIVSSQSSAVLPIVQNGIHAAAITQSFLLLRVRVSRVR